MDACEGHENQSQALRQYVPSEIPTSALFPQLMALSLGPHHYFLAPARAPALISKVGHKYESGWVDNRPRGGEDATPESGARDSQLHYEEETQVDKLKKGTC